MTLLSSFLAHMNKTLLSERAADSTKLRCNKEYEIKMASWIPHTDDRRDKNSCETKS